MSKRRRGTGDAEFKIILVGDSGAGKSSLLQRYLKGHFSPEHVVTIGAEFESKQIEVDEHYKVRLQIWDTAGQEAFKSIAKSFYRNSAAILLVYDMTKTDSFEHLAHWLHQTRENASPKALFILVGTHSDLQQREVSREAAEEFVARNQISLAFETSAKENVNVSQTFEEIAKQLFVVYLKRRKNSEDDYNRMRLSSAEADRQWRQCCLP